MKRTDAIRHIAELICFQSCRAGKCRDEQRCCCGYPGPGYSYFEAYLAVAQQLVNVARLPEQTVRDQPDRIKVFTVAHIEPGLEHAWLQHLRDFDVAHPGNHFEVIADAPNATFAEIVEALRINPGLPVQQVIERTKREAQ